MVPNEPVPKDVGAEESAYTEKGLQNLKPELAAVIRERIARAKDGPPQPEKTNVSSQSANQGKKLGKHRQSYIPRAWEESNPFDAKKAASGDNS